MFKQVKYSERLRYVPPTMATAGKVIQAAGVNLFGVQKTFEAYDWKNHNKILDCTRPMQCRQKTTCTGFFSACRLDH